MARGIGVSSNRTGDGNFTQKRFLKDSENQPGFTLSELMMAMLVMMVGLVADAVHRPACRYKEWPSCD